MLFVCYSMYQDYEFVHVGRHGDGIYSCTCDAHNTLSVLAFMASRGEENWEGMHCVHVLFLQEMYNEVS